MTRENLQATTSKKNGDRKRKGASDSPRKVMAFRVAAETYDKLQASSQERGLSLTEEIERRIAFSFDMADTPRNEFILRALAQALRYTEAVMDMPWNKSEAAALACKDALCTASDLVLHSYDRALHPFDVSGISVEDTKEQAVAKRRAKSAEGVGQAGNDIGHQVVQAFLGRSIEEIRNIGADHIRAAKAFAERWEEETFGGAGKREAEYRGRQGGLGNTRASLDADEGEATAAPTETPTRTERRRSAKTIP